jgi:hypothetical protein
MELLLLRALTMLDQLLPHPLNHNSHDLSLAQLGEVMPPQQVTGEVQVNPNQLVTGEAQVNPRQLAVTVPQSVARLVQQLERGVAKTRTKPLLVKLEVEEVPEVALPLLMPTTGHQDHQVDHPLVDLDPLLVLGKVEHQALLQLLMEHQLQDHSEVQQVELSQQELDMERLLVELDPALGPLLILQLVQAMELQRAAMNFQVMENNFLPKL